MGIYRIIECLGKLLEEKINKSPLLKIKKPTCSIIHTVKGKPSCKPSHTTFAAFLAKPPRPGYTSEFGTRSELYVRNYV